MSLQEHQYSKFNENRLEFAFHKVKIYDNYIRYNIKIGKKIKRDLEIKKSNIRWLCNAERSARRVYEVVSDICECNNFDWFATLTFTSDTSKVTDRLDDKETRKLFGQWRNEMKRKLPNMKYVAICEYHKKGGLHWHLVLGDVTANELGLIYSKSVFSNILGADMPIYNISTWKKGFSTCSKIASKESTKGYILKYVTKGGVDPRFFRKQRFTCSQNVLRPEIIKESNICNSFNADEFQDVLGLDIDFINYNYSSFKYIMQKNIQDII